ncbi:lysine-specific demethylase 5 [Ochlerotatus camptorhynchus]|uniref:lysine-specific demethylase 5 n=1 Tax=Ochlerotatus camptorhynchus TaxID=644619 RepID=UPI0031DF0B2D
MKSKNKLINSPGSGSENVSSNYPCSVSNGANPLLSAASGECAQQLQKPHISLDKYDEFQFKVPPEAPVFEPSEEDFKNPLIYINKIRPIAEKYGICKIRPPTSWQPPFTVDVEKLTFVPRVQRLNELEAETRIKLNFLDQIAKFWELQGSSLKIPMVERKPLDLYTLHKVVNEEGGIEVVTKERKWSRVACRMGYQQGKNVGTNLKAHYERILYPFDIYRSGKIIDLANLETEQEDCEYKPHSIEARQQIQPPPATTARRSQRFAQMNKSASIGAENDSSRTSPGKYRMKSTNGSTRNKSEILYTPNQHDPMAKYICLMCNRGDVEESMLLCDGCDASYHTFCLLPPLQEIPKGDWRCPKCIVEENSKPVEAFGFEQAQREYTLQQFGEMADQFKSNYFNMPVHLVPTELVEKEFWRIVSSIDEDVTVEYGADLHTMDHGSGFPTKSSLYLLPEDQEYAESSWNLNNLPVLDESILGHINADISGMKVPWMYVGMCFATFCWHNEDHWSYSINYLHWGEPKTWYGVPGSRAEEFEMAMKSAAPELFQSQPDLLHQLVTIMNPNILMNANVPVYRTDQHAGEFIVTFPRAYHAGFNQGYNFAEAVNFAPADWMKMGRECVNHYSKLRRYCVFSHDELVCKMALEPDRLNLGIATACYIDMAEMVDTEKKLRKNLLEWGVTNAEREAFELLSDDARQCEVCKTTCFLSAVTCKCTTNLACLRHFAELCECPSENHTLKYRYTLDELPLMVQKLKVKAESFEKWLFKVRDVLDPAVSTNITLDELQEIAQEAETQKFPNSVILERLNFSILEAQKCITVIQQLDINKIRTRTRNSAECAKYKLTLEELDMFVNEINNLRCIIREGDSVRELQKIGKEWVKQVECALNTRFKDTNIQQHTHLIDEGNSLCIELPQIVQLKDRLAQFKWYKQVRLLRENTIDRLSLDEIKKLLDEGMNILPHTVLEKELAELHGIMLQVNYSTEKKKSKISTCFSLFLLHTV